MTEVLAKIIPILSEYSSLDAGDINPKDALENLDIDSLSLVEIIFDLEELFDIKIPDEAELDAMGMSLNNVNSIVILVEKLLKDKAS